MDGDTRRHVNAPKHMPARADLFSFSHFSAPISIAFDLLIAQSLRKIGEIWCERAKEQKDKMANLILNEKNAITFYFDLNQTEMCKLVEKNHNIHSVI